MQQLRGFDSLSIPDLLRGVTPIPPLPPDLWAADNQAIREAPPYRIAGQPMMPPAPRNGLTPERLRALKQSMVRIAPVVPPDVLRQHYFRRLAEMSNPAAELPQSRRDMGRQNSFTAAAEARFAQRGNRAVQPVGKGSERTSIAKQMNGVAPTPISTSNMPSAMDDMRVRAIQAVPVAAVSANDLRRDIARMAPPGRRNSIAKNVNRPAGSLGPARAGAAPATFDDLDWAASWGLGDTPLPPDPVATRAAGEVIGPAARWAPLVGAGLDTYDDIQKGDYGWGGADGLLFFLDAALAGAVARGALKYGTKGLWKSGSQSWNNVRPWLGKLMNLPKGTEVHHALIPQRYKDLVPEWVLNHPLNLKPMYGDTVGGRTTRQLHNAVHGWGTTRFAPDNELLDQLYRIHYGWPGWAKVGVPAAAASAAGNFAKMTGEMGAEYPDLYTTYSFAP